jgi:hypothetical protein
LPIFWHAEVVVVTERPNTLQSLGVIAPAVLATWLLAAHFLRYAFIPGVVICLALPLPLLLRRAWAVRLVQTGLGLGSGLWVYTAMQIVGARLREHGQAVRPAMILGAVTVFAVLAALLLESRAARKILRRARSR